MTKQVLKHKKTSKSFNKSSKSLIKGKNNINFKSKTIKNLSVLKISLKKICIENTKLKSELYKLEAYISNTKDTIEDYEEIILELNTKYNVWLSKYNKLLNN